MRGYFVSGRKKSSSSSRRSRKKRKINVVDHLTRRDLFQFLHSSLPSHSLFDEFFFTITHWCTRFQCSLRRSALSSTVLVGNCMPPCCAPLAYEVSDLVKTWEAFLVRCAWHMQARYSLSLEGSLGAFYALPWRILCPPLASSSVGQLSLAIAGQGLASQLMLRLHVQGCETV